MLPITVKQSGGFASNKRVFWYFTSIRGVKAACNKDLPQAAAA